MWSSWFLPLVILDAANELIYLWETETWQVLTGYSDNEHSLFTSVQAPAVESELDFVKLLIAATPQKTVLQKRHKAPQAISK